jgi:hypothetical protein
MGKNKAAELAQEIIDEINMNLSDLSDSEYVECLEEIWEACDSAASAKHAEIGEED